MIGKEHHISSAKFLMTIFGALVFLTLLTTGMHYVHIPSPWAVIVSMLIGLVKAGLVAFFFMNLWWDEKFNLIAFIASVGFVILLVAITLLDLLFRSPTDHPW